MHFRTEIINGKKVFIVRDHQYVLQGWAEYRKEQLSPPYLLSLDHHTDTHESFAHASFVGDEVMLDRERQKRFIAEVDYANIETVINASHRLRNDEHINTAIDTGIIEKAFIISYDNSFDHPTSHEEKEYVDKVQKSFYGLCPRPQRPKRPFAYPDADIYLAENLCAIGCSKESHNDDCLIPHYNQAIETILLEDKMSIFEEMNSEAVSGGDFTKEYILDIDLDYFHTCRSIVPADTGKFYELVRNSGMITIATEDSFVDAWREEQEFDPDINSDFLLEHLLHHIQLATD